MATALWTGDTFTINRSLTACSTGGECSPLSPYQWSSAWMQGKGFVRHSNTDPTAHGATVVQDGVLDRQIIKLNADERVNNIGLISNPYTRMEIRGKAQFGPGMVRWVIGEVFIPASTPTMPKASNWWTIMSIFGPPYGGAGPSTFSLSRNLAGTGNDLTWKTPTGAVMWRTPALTGVWHILARKIKFSTSASDGYSEVWYSRRDTTGRPIGPLARQTVKPPNLTARQRYYYQTLGRNNWDGKSLNHADVKNYHSAGMWPGRTFTALYFAGYRVYDGAVPVEQIDPYALGA